MATTDPCHAATSGHGYWTCDAHGGCRDCRSLARQAEDDTQIALWNAQRNSPLPTS